MIETDTNPDVTRDRSNVSVDSSFGSGMSYITSTTVSSLRTAADENDIVVAAIGTDDLAKRLYVRRWLLLKR